MHECWGKVLMSSLLSTLFIFIFCIIFFQFLTNTGRRRTRGTGVLAEVMDGGSGYATLSFFILIFCIIFFQFLTNTGRRRTRGAGVLAEAMDGGSGCEQMQ